MDFDRINSLMLLGGSFPEFPLLLSEPDSDLMPLPESLSTRQFDDSLGFYSPIQLPADDSSLDLAPSEHRQLDDQFDDGLGFYSRFRLPADDSSSLDLAPYEHQQLDDLDLESFVAWPNCSISPDSNDAILDVLPLNSCNFPLSDEAIEDGGGGGAVIAWDEKKQADEKTTSSGRTTATASRLSDVGFDEIRNYFCMPIMEAAKEMNVGLTVLKKRCRELGIARWPHRKMKSLKSLIRNVQELGSCEDSVKDELERLEEHKKLMEENPEMPLTERTKRLRQACFKANYKRRRLLQHA